MDAAMLRRVRQLSLRIKASVAVMILLAAAVSLSIALLTQRHFRHLEHLHRESLQAQAVNLSMLCTLAMERNDRRELARVINHALGARQVAFVSILDARDQLHGYAVRNAVAWAQHIHQPGVEQGYLLASHPIVLSKPEPMSATDGDGRRGFSDALPADSAVLLSPETDAGLSIEQALNPDIIASGVVLGRVEIAENCDVLLCQQTSFAASGLGIAGFVVLLGGGMTYLLVSRLGRRLTALELASRKISQGQLDAQVPQGGNDEVGRLAACFETMRQAVHDRDQALRRFNDLLQHEIDQRTAELVGAKETAEEAAACLRQANDRLINEVAERQRSEQALRCTQERYALAARGANDGLWDWDLQNNNVYYSTRWKSMLGYEDAEWSESLDEWHRRVHPDDMPRLRNDLSEHCDGQVPHFENEHRLLHKDGQYRWVLSRGVAEKGSDGRPKRMAGSLTDITDRKLAEQRLRHQALHDELTGLPNRTLLMDRLTHCLLRAKRHKDFIFAVAFIDLDRFKIVNDSLGHAAGDQLLIEFSRRLNSLLRKSDTVARVEDDALARLGGDEFVLVLEDLADLAAVGRVAQRLQQVFTKPYDIAGQEVFTTGSIGVAVGDSSYERAEDLLRDADMAMYRAKGAGRDRYEIYDKQMHREAVERLRLENDLRRALDAQQFMLNYQPIVELETGQIIGFEALVRWDHPERGVVSPIQFIPLAEETGMIVPLGIWVLKQACLELQQFNRRHPDHAPITISVNLSKRQISEPGLVGHVRQILEETGVPGHLLKLEITESVIMEASEGLIPVLEQLRGMGCQLHMDDFGTGYSSLSCLHRFPLDVIKIDRAFVVNMTDDPRYAAVVNAIVTLAHNLGMRVTAEGVETREQLAQVLSLECDFGQGHFFSRPVDLKGAMSMLDTDLPWLASV
ncbi:MAG: EAL domain-containing protein [Phycisphaeraceae bacterium]|nr:EAL domain-containing protein [Phycisphaeraceae bacterium]